jgi:hypothetical protein
MPTEPDSSIDPVEVAAQFEAAVERIREMLVQLFDFIFAENS